ncbi:hypothetical protein [Novosphingobium sp. PhB57]|uniref:hypothetical protein n=1 Tax=Novosphingobium sp. PhB57 TaxID=2485107 RepID=UPI0010489B44|nr:hypothetical protein [Novosphingobium sp. PhB57]
MYARLLRRTVSEAPLRLAAAFPSNHSIGSEVEQADTLVRLASEDLAAVATLPGAAQALERLSVVSGLLLSIYDRLATVQEALMGGTEPSPTA